MNKEIPLRWLEVSPAPEHKLQIWCGDYWADVPIVSPQAAAAAATPALPSVPQPGAPALLEANAT